MEGYMVINQNWIPAKGLGPVVSMTKREEDGFIH